MSKAAKSQRVQPCSFICHVCVLLAALMLVQSFLQVDESTARKELDLKMMLIVGVSMPNDVSGATH